MGLLLLQFTPRVIGITAAFFGAVFVRFSSLLALIYLPSFHSLPSFFLVFALSLVSPSSFPVSFPAGWRRRRRRRLVLANPIPSRRDFVLT